MENQFGAALQSAEQHMEALIWLRRIVSDTSMACWLLRTWRIEPESGLPRHLGKHLENAKTLFLDIMFWQKQNAEAMQEFESNLVGFGVWALGKHAKEATDVLGRLAVKFPSLPTVLVTRANARLLGAVLSLWLTSLVTSLHDTKWHQHKFSTLSWWHQQWQTLEQAARQSRLIHVCWGHPSKTEIASTFEIEESTTELFKQVGPHSEQDQLDMLDGQLLNRVLVKSALSHYVLCQSTTNIMQRPGMSENMGHFLLQEASGLCSLWRKMCDLDALLSKPKPKKQKWLFGRLVDAATQLSAITGLVASDVKSAAVDDARAAQTFIDGISEDYMWMFRHSRKKRELSGGFWRWGNTFQLFAVHRNNEKMLGDLAEAAFTWASNAVDELEERKHLKRTLFIMLSSSTLWSTVPDPQAALKRLQAKSKGIVSQWHAPADQFYESHFLDKTVGKLGEGLVGSVRQTEAMPPISWDLKQPHPHHPEYSLGGVAFVHLLQFISLRFNDEYQSIIKTACDSLGPGNAVHYPAGPKSPYRMFSKYMNDHAHDEAPRAASNIDTIRCCVVCEEDQNLVKLYNKLSKIFGGVLRCKNGYRNKEAGDISLGYRACLINVMFTPKPDGKPMTWGELALEEEAAKKWNDHYHKIFERTGISVDTAISLTAAVGDETLPIDIARDWMVSEGVRDRNIQIVSEVQLLMQYYLDMRKKTHAYYKVIRAESPTGLMQDCTPSFAQLFECCQDPEEYWSQENTRVQDVLQI